MHFEQVLKLQLWYNNLPAGEKVECYLGPVKALPMVPELIINPTVKVSGKTITFQASMKSGDYLEFRPGLHCNVFGPKGEIIQKDVSYTGEIPDLENGVNSITFNCEQHNKGISYRAQVTIISEGNPLEIN